MLDLYSKLGRIRDRRHAEDAHLDAIKNLLNNHQSLESRIESENDVMSNNFDIDLLESGRVYHISEIKKLCVNYRLRFLETALFRNKMPTEALEEIQRLEEEHNTVLDGFRIIAPGKLFKLENADDPILFAPIGNDYFYFIHKWGKDMSSMRKWLMLPLRSLETLVITTVVVSIALTYVVPEGLFSKTHSAVESLLVFFFMFKSVAAIVVYYSFARGKNVSNAVWDSKFLNA